MVDNVTTRQALASFLIIEGTLSILFSTNKSPLYQLGRLARIGIGLYFLKIK